MHTFFGTNEDQTKENIYARQASIRVAFFISLSISYKNQYYNGKSS